MRGGEASFLRLILRLIATAAFSAAFGLAGAFLAYWLGYLLIEVGFIRANTFVDDDLALKNIGIAMIGGLAGIVIGAVVGWRAARRRG
ncbi:MAG: hypothetical protein K2X34_12905 [Hyphomonadaceae bacterium]|nr:hypothetical protein [Hyphomonadaceae bacterium]MBY0423085.1 hypothetical protein [Parvularculaceae bacterium]